MGVERSKILLVDPDERSGRLLELSLEKEGFEVKAVGGTIDALMALHAETFAVLISEVDLADGDGFELLEQVRLDPETAALPFLIVTSKTGDQTRDRATGLGASDVIGKPVRVKQVLERIRTLTGQAEATQADHDLSAVYTVEYRSFVAQLGKLPEEANAVIRLFNGRRTVAEVVRESGVGEAKTREILGKLIEAEVLRPVEGDALDAAMRGRPDPEAERARREEQERASLLARAAQSERERLEGEARVAEEAARTAAEAARLAAEEAQRKAEEARQRLEEEQRRQAEEERRRREEEINEIDAEIAELEAVRTRDLEDARSRADLVRAEAERLAADLRAEAEAKAEELQRRERELAGRKRSLTQRMEALVPGIRPPVHEEPERVPPRAAATLTLTPDPAVGRAVAGHPREEATDPWTGQEVAQEPEASPPPARVAATAPLVVEPADVPADPVRAPSEQSIELSSPSVSGSLDDSFFGRGPIENAHEDELFAEPQREGVPPIVWAIGLLLLTALFVVLLSSGRDSTPEPEAEPEPVAELTTEPPEGTAEAAPVEPVGPTAAEIAEAEAAVAQANALQGAIDQATETQYLASDIAEAVSFGVGPEVVVEPPEPVAARDDRDTRRTEPRPRTDTRPREPNDHDVDSAVRACATAYGDGNYAETITACEDAVRAAPTNSDAYTYLGKANYELGDVDQAISYLERAVRMNARNRNALLALGAAKQDAGDTDGARQAYERYLEYYPDSRHASEVRSVLESL